MTVDEVREIRERMSLETAGMSAEELRNYYSQGAAEAERRIAEIRSENGIEFYSQQANAVSVVRG